MYDPDTAYAQASKRSARRSERQDFMLSVFRGGFVPSVQGNILLLSLAAVIATAVCSAIFIIQTRANIEAQVFEDQASLGQSYARVVQEYLDGSRSVMVGLASVPAVSAPLRPELSQPDVDVERRASIAGVIQGSHSAAQRSGPRASTVTST